MNHRIAKTQSADDHSGVLFRSLRKRAGRLGADYVRLIEMWRRAWTHCSLSVSDNRLWSRFPGAPSGGRAQGDPRPTNLRTGSG